MGIIRRKLMLVTIGTWRVKMCLPWAGNGVWWWLLDCMPVLASPLCDKHYPWSFGFNIQFHLGLTGFFRLASRDVFSFQSNQHFQLYLWFDSLRKQPTFRAEWRLRKEHRNSTLITRHYPDLGNVSDWLCRMENLLQQIRSTTQIWVVTHHQYGISAFVGKPVLVQQNFSCFCRLVVWKFQVCQSKQS